jgi:phosphatidylinositol-bisphosphatase
MSSVRTSYEHGDSMSTEYDQINHPTNSTPHSLSHAVQARRAEYTRPHTVKVKIGTWNVAACPGTDKDIAGWFVDGKGVDKELSGLDHHTGREC